MTFKEADELIKENWDKVSALLSKQEPPRDLLGFIIAPESIYTDSGVRQYLFNRCIEKGESNEIALLDLQPYLYFSPNLVPFVVIKLNGHNISLPLTDYLLDMAATEDGNAS